MGGYTYWEYLNKLGLYSQQRRRELIPDPTPFLLRPKLNPRTGRTCERQILPTQAPQRIKTLVASSLSHNGPVILNALPRKIRDLTSCSVDKFKRELDNFLRILPDKHPVPGYTANCRAASNSVPDQFRFRHEDL